VCSALALKTTSSRSIQAQIRMKNHTDPLLSRRNTAQGLQNTGIWVESQWNPSREKPFNR
jgi:hypothetical protein